MLTLRTLTAARLGASRCFASSTDKQPTKKMEQVEVDEAAIKEQLGNLRMTFVKKAERQNAERAWRHVRHRRKDWIIGLTCFSAAVSIYAYTFFAMKQEKFLDDFEMPDPLEEEERRR